MLHRRRQADRLGGTQFAVRFTQIAHGALYSCQFDPYACCIRLLVQDHPQQDGGVGMAKLPVREHQRQAEQGLVPELALLVLDQGSIKLLGADVVTSVARGVGEGEDLRVRKAGLRVTRG